MRRPAIRTACLALAAALAWAPPAAAEPVTALAYIADGPEYMPASEPIAEAYVAETRRALADAWVEARTLGAVLGDAAPDPTALAGREGIEAAVAALAGAEAEVARLVTLQLRASVAMGEEETSLHLTYFGSVRRVDTGELLSVAEAEIAPGEVALPESCPRACLLDLIRAQAAPLSERLLADLGLGG